MPRTELPDCTVSRSNIVRGRSKVSLSLGDSLIGDGADRFYLASEAYLQTQWQVAVNERAGQLSFEHRNTMLAKLPLVSPLAVVCVPAPIIDRRGGFWSRTEGLKGAF